MLCNVIQVRFAQLLVFFFDHFSFSDHSADSALSPIVLASSFLSIPSSYFPSSSSLLSSFWWLFPLLLWLLSAGWLLQLLEAWSMLLGLLLWAVSPFKKKRLERKCFGFRTWTLGTLCAPHPPRCRRRQRRRGRSSLQTQSFGPSRDLLRRKPHLPKSKPQVHGIGLSQTREDKWFTRQKHSYLAFVTVSVLVKVFPITSLLPINPAPLEEIGGIFDSPYTYIHPSR